MNAVDCGQASLMMDDYREHRLGLEDRQRLETHLSRCSRCVAELNHEAALDRTLRGAIATSVQSMQLPGQVLTRIIAASQRNARRAARFQRLVPGARIGAGALAVALLVAALGYSLRQVTPLWPGLSLPIPGAGRSPHALTLSDLVITPSDLRPGDLFTATFVVYNERDQALPVQQINLDIKGPGRGYHYVLGSQEKVPARGAAVLKVTPGWLSDATEDQYNTLAGDILSKPGTYTISLTLFSPADMPVR